MRKHFFIEPILTLIAGALFTALFSGGCAGKAINESDPAAVYQAAEEDIEDAKYELALEKLRMVKNKFPYSNYSAKAKLRIGDVQFQQENYLEAAASYEGFRDLHPNHESVTYAMFRTGESYYQDIPGNIARDLTSAQKALDAFNHFLERFPQDPQTQTARERVKSIRNTLAEKELYIASFYRRQDQVQSARARYQKLLTLYPDSEFAKEAKEKLQLLPKEK